MAFTSAGKNSLVWTKESECDLIRSICLRGMLLAYSLGDESRLGKVRNARWRVITADMRNWGWCFSLKALRNRWEVSLQPRLDVIDEEGSIEIPEGVSRECKVAKLAGLEIDGVTNKKPKLPEPEAFDGNDSEIATPQPQASPATSTHIVAQPGYYEDKVSPEELGLTTQIQDEIIARFRNLNFDNMLGARALMTDILAAFNRSVEYSLAAGLHPGPAYFMRYQLHYIYCAWKLVMDKDMPPMTEKQKEGVESVEVEEMVLRWQHCDNNKRFRVWEQQQLQRARLAQSYSHYGYPQTAQSLAFLAYGQNVGQNGYVAAPAQYAPQAPIPQTAQNLNAALSKEGPPNGNPFSLGQKHLTKPKPSGLHSKPFEKRYKAKTVKKRGQDSDDELFEDDYLERTEETRKKQRKDRQERAARRNSKKLVPEENKAVEGSYEEEVNNAEAA
ncbi:hypothetical protein PG987_001375 [Apiospora arundinis]